MIWKPIILIELRPYVFCFYRLRKLAARYNRDLTPYEIEKCEKHTIAFDDEKCVEKALNFCLKLKGEEYKDKKGKISEYHLQLHVHMGSGFVTWIVSNNLSYDKKNCEYNKKRKRHNTIEGNQRIY